MCNYIELLGTKYLLPSQEFTLFKYWKKVFGAEVGWHYPIDIVWQIHKIRMLNLEPGAMILDLGAGNGLVQYILASLGYEVISVDFTPRSIPKIKKQIFNIDTLHGDSTSNSYIKHIAELKKQKHRTFLQKCKLLLTRLNFAVLKEMFCKNVYGKITFYQTDFEFMSLLEENSIDAIVSTSAIEHVEDFKKLKRSFNEFCRVLKNGNQMFITTSVADKCQWHTPSKGWCFDLETISDITGCDKKNSNFTEYSRIFSEIEQCTYLKENLASFHTNNENCGMPNGVWNPLYIPAGITIVNSK